MSIRAYRVNKINYNGESFNLSHDEALITFLQTEGFFESLNMDCAGFTEISVSLLERALKEVKGLNNGVKENIKKDIEWAKNKDEEYITYSCF